MLSLQAEYQQLSDEAKLRLQSFYRRFCQGENGRIYGLGHLVYAAHASFPLVLSPELANLIWLNFKNYYYINGNEAGQSQLVAVADFLLSPLCRKMGQKRYDVYPEIRSFLLLLLQDGKWFAGYGIKTDGKSRLNELAHFLKQFLATKAPDEKYDGVGFSQLNEWAVAAWLDPQLLTKELAKSFQQSAGNNNENAQLWLTLQMDKVGLQYGFNVSNAQSNRELSPFYRLYYYGKAREGQLYNKPAREIYQYSGEITEFVESGTVSNEIIVKLPLLKSVAERTERKINKVQRVLSLLIGVDRSEHFPNAFVSTYGISKLKNALLNLKTQQNLDIEEIVELRSFGATKKAINEQVKNMLSQANPEDICFIYYAGFSGVDASGNSGLFTYPDTTANQTDDFISNTELLNTIQQAKKQPAPQVIFVLDVNEATHLFPIEKNDLMLGSVRLPDERHYDSTREESISSFADAFATVLNHMGATINYKDLATFIQYKMQQEYNLQDNRVILKSSNNNHYKHLLAYSSAVPDDAQLIAYNRSIDNWQLLPDDFAVIPENLVAHIFDYNTNQLATETSGEIFMDERTDTYRFDCSAADSLEKEKLYKIRVQKPALYRIPEMGSRPIPDLQSEKSLMDVELDKLSGTPDALWNSLLDGTVTSFPNMSTVFHKNEINYYWTDDVSAIHIYRLVRGRFTLEINWQSDKKLIYTGDHGQIVQRLKWYKQNYDLLNSSLPFIYADLDISVEYYWQKTSGEKLTGSIGKILPVLTETMYLEDGGNIRFHPLGIQLINRESFPVFFAAYFLCSDFSIKPIPEANNILQAGETRQTNNDITDLLIEMAEKKMTMQYKILFSRNPIQINTKYTV